MKYYLSKILEPISMDDAETLVREKLMKVGFGVVMEINMAATLKNKLDVEVQPYKILGACNPKFAYEALQKEDKIGVLLPCNVCIQQRADNSIEVFAVNPLVAMEAVENSEVEGLAKEVYEKLKSMIASL